MPNYFIPSEYYLTTNTGVPLTDNYGDFIFIIAVPDAFYDMDGSYPPKKPILKRARPDYSIYNHPDFHSLSSELPVEGIFFDHDGEDQHEDPAEEFSESAAAGPSAPERAPTLLGLDHVGLFGKSWGHTTPSPQPSVRAVAPKAPDRSADDVFSAILQASTSRKTPEESSIMSIVTNGMLNM